jgi:3-oxoacyl-[acyl-carrier-protein] synthase II
LFTQYGVVAADEAIKDAGIDFDLLDRNRIGVIWGACNGGVTSYDQDMIDYVQNDMTPRFNPFLIPRMIVDICSGVISIRHGLRGLNYATVSACATSTTSIIDAFNHIRLGKANMIITGGSEAAITHSAIGGFSSAKALSPNNENAEKASRPWDEERDGFVMGEGAGAIIVESLEHAQARGAKIYAEVVGGGMAADAYHLTGTHPEGEGGYLAMKEAVEEAGISPEQVDYLNAHATSTPGGDGNELKAVKRLFEEGENLQISGTKSMTGHLLGAAGAVEAIACIKACQENKIPATINTENVAEGIDLGLNLLIGDSIEKEVNYAMSNSFGFGGHTASVLFKKYSS